MATATDQDLVNTIAGLQKQIEALAAQPVSRGYDEKHVHKAYRSNDNQWPEDQLSGLEVYDEHAARMFIRPDANGRPRKNLLGWGPMLIKMAALQGYREYVEAAKQLPDWTPGYNEDSLEAEYKKKGKYGPISVSKAAKNGIPWDPANSQVRKTALAEGSGVTGGYLIPPQYMTDLLTIQGEESFFAPRARVQPMTSRTVQWPVLDITTAQSTGISPYFGGISMTWTPEAASIAESEPAFRMTEWTAWDMCLFAISSNQLLADNGIGLDAMMTMLFGQAAAWYSEYAYLRGLGAGSSMPLGVLNSPCAIQVTRTVASRFVLADACAMMSRLQARSWDNAIWIAHQSVLPQLIQMASGAVANTASTTYIPGNQTVWINPMPSGDVGPAAMKLPKVFLNGLPMFFTEKLPQLGTTGDVMLVDPSAYIIGQRLDTQIDVSPHYLFRNNQLCWRVVFRSDGKFWMNNAITDSQGWTISPAVVLR